MHVIGLTGGIASGKSTVSRHLAELGAIILDADQIARVIVDPGKPVLQKLVQEFGEDILLPNGSLDRARLGKLVFEDQARRDTLNQITHPMIIAEIKERIAKLRESGACSQRVVVIDAPLLIEAGLVPLVEAVWLVTVDRETQIKRLMKRDGFSREEAEARLRSQMPLEQKLAYADQLIPNIGTVEETIARVNELWNRLTDNTE